MYWSGVLVLAMPRQLVVYCSTESSILSTQQSQKPYYSTVISYFFGQNIFSFYKYNVFFYIACSRFLVFRLGFYFLFFLVLFRLARRVGKVLIPAECEQGSCKSCTVRVQVDDSQWVDVRLYLHYCFILHFLVLFFLQNFCFHTFSYILCFVCFQKCVLNLCKVLACVEPATEGLIVEVGSSSSSNENPSVGAVESKATFFEEKAWQKKQAELDRAHREEVHIQPLIIKTLSRLWLIISKFCLISFYYNIFSNNISLIIIFSKRSLICQVWTFSSF